MSVLGAASWDVVWWTIMVIIAAANWLIASYMFSHSTLPQPEILILGVDLGSSFGTAVISAYAYGWSCFSCQHRESMSKSNRHERRVAYNLYNL